MPPALRALDTLEGTVCSGPTLPAAPASLAVSSAPEAQGRPSHPPPTISSSEPLREGKEQQAGPPDPTRDPGTGPRSGGPQSAPQAPAQQGPCPPVRRLLFRREEPLSQRGRLDAGRMDGLSGSAAAPPCLARAPGASPQGPCGPAPVSRGPGGHRPGRHLLRSLCPPPQAPRKVKLRGQHSAWCVEGPCEQVEPQCGPPAHPGLRPPPGLAAGKAQGNFLQEAGCPWPGRVCRASGGALGGQTSLGPGEGAFLLPEPAGRGFPEAQGGLAGSPRGAPPALPAWQEGAGQQQQACVPALLGTPRTPPGLPPPRPRASPPGLRPDKAGPPLAGPDRRVPGLCCPLCPPSAPPSGRLREDMWARSPPPQEAEEGG
ncbi:basic salivary proline-rich protein 4-like [Muntiacus reevesi]|uniref:basic salivary proline-rich protein 4-like n=1 Tax=Muntiacus reevesi TaxID=9886 RepID=UPI00330795CB